MAIGVRDDSPTAVTRLETCLLARIQKRCIIK